MKKAFLIVLAVVIGFSSCEDDDMRDSDVPSVVLNGFISMFPNAEKVEWEKRSDLFEAEFEIDNVEYDALLDAEGSILKYKYDILFEKLPEAVKTSITNQFDRTKVDDTEVLLIAETTYYQIKFDEEPQDNHVIFEESGQVNTNISPW